MLARMNTLKKESTIITQYRLINNNGNMGWRAIIISTSAPQHWQG
jgi:hypothetical protein